MDVNCLHCNTENALINENCWSCGTMLFYETPPSDNPPARALMFNGEVVRGLVEEGGKIQLYAHNALVLNDVEKEIADRWVEASLEKMQVVD